MLLELTRVSLFDLCWILALLLTFRLSFPSPIVLMSLRIGLILVLAEGLIRFAAGFGISVVGGQHYPTFDLARSWASAAGAIGALLICVGLFWLLPLLWAGKGVGRKLRGQNRNVEADTWII
jgi:hypothetical protein